MRDAPAGAQARRRGRYRGEHMPPEGGREAERAADGATAEEQRSDYRMPWLDPARGEAEPPAARSAEAY